MALTLNDFSGAETGGLEEVFSVSGTPTASDVNPRSGAYAYRFAAGDNIIFTPFTPIADAGSGYVCGASFNFDDVTPSANILFFRMREGVGNTFLRLELDTSGNVLLKNSPGTTIRTITTPFIAGINYFVEVYFQHADPGDCEIFINNVSQGTNSSDFTAGGTFDRFNPTNSGSSATTFDMDDYYLLSGATAATDRYRNFKVKAFQNTAEDATDQGDTLADGTWALVSETPANEGTLNDAQYQDTGNLTGSTIMDEGTRAGPSGDSDITGATIKGAKFLGTYKRGAGGGRTHSMLTGSDETVSGFPQATTTIALTTDYVVHERLVAAGVVEVPTISDFFQMGFSKSATAGQNIFCGDQWAMLGYVPLSGPPPIINLVMAPYTPAGR